MVRPMKGNTGTRRERPLDLLELSGEVDFAPDFDLKALRALRVPSGAAVDASSYTSKRGRKRFRNRAGLHEDDAE